MQYLVSVIHDKDDLVTAEERAAIDLPLKLAAEGSKACNRKAEVRLFR